MVTLSIGVGNLAWHRRRCGLTGASADLHRALQLYGRVGWRDPERCGPGLGGQSIRHYLEWRQRNHKSRTHAKRFSGKNVVITRLGSLDRNPPSCSSSTNSPGQIVGGVWQTALTKPWGLVGERRSHHRFAETGSSWLWRDIGTEQRQIMPWSARSMLPLRAGDSVC